MNRQGTCTSEKLLISAGSGIDLRDSVLFVTVLDITMCTMSYGSACGEQREGIAQRDKSINSINDLCQRGIAGDMRIKDQRSMLIFIFIFTGLFASIWPRFQQ